MSLGSTLREARERKGLTIAQVAEHTRMIHQLVEEIENDDFHRISAPIYGRGFVKLFAECVGEEPGPLIQEFTEIYSGLRRPGVRTRPVQTPVEMPEVAEPKDRNAPPPRPKVRHVIVADDPEDKPAVTAPVETPKDTGKDAPTARPSEPVASPKVEVEIPSDTGRDAPTARPSGRIEETFQPVTSEPTSSPKAEVEIPSDTGRDAPTARPSGRFEETSLPAASEPTASPKAEVESSADTDKDAPTARPSEPAAEPASVESLKAAGDAGILPVAEGEGAVATQGADLPEAASILSAAEGEGAVATQGEGPASSGPNGPTDEPSNRPTVSDEPTDDESLIGELFDFVARKRSQRSDEPSTDKHKAKDESSVKISLPAPSWDDAPLEEDGDLFSKILRYVNVKVVAAVLGGIVLLSAIVFGVVAKRHSKPESGTDTPVVSQAATAPESTPESVPEPAPEPQPESQPAPEGLATRNAELETPSAEAATAASADGRTVYTANLIPPPDSYVE